MFPGQAALISHKKMLEMNILSTIPTLLSQKSGGGTQQSVLTSSLSDSDV
jgi:hypothetical protein